MILRESWSVFREITAESRGINVPAICDKYGAVLAANAGGFEDIGGVGDGGTPRELLCPKEH